MDVGLRLSLLHYKNPSCITRQPSLLLLFIRKKVELLERARAVWAARTGLTVDSCHRKKRDTNGWKAGHKEN